MLTKLACHCDAPEIGSTELRALRAKNRFVESIDIFQPELRVASEVCSVICCSDFEIELNISNWKGGKHTMCHIAIADRTGTPGFN